MTCHHNVYELEQELDRALRQLRAQLYGLGGPNPDAVNNQVIEDFIVRTLALFWRPPKRVAELSITWSSVKELRRALREAKQHEREAAGVAV